MSDVIKTKSIDDRRFRGKKYNENRSKYRNLMCKTMRNLAKLRCFLKKNIHSFVLKMKLDVIVCCVYVKNFLFLFISVFVFDPVQLFSAKTFCKKWKKANLLIICAITFVWHAIYSFYSHWKQLLVTTAKTIL